MSRDVAPGKRGRVVSYRRGRPRLRVAPLLAAAPSGLIGCCTHSRGKPQAWPFIKPPAWPGSGGMLILLVMELARSRGAVTGAPRFMHASMLCAASLRHTKWSLLAPAVCSGSTPRPWQAMSKHIRRSSSLNSGISSSGSSAFCTAAVLQHQLGRLSDCSNSSLMREEALHPLPSLSCPETMPCNDSGASPRKVSRSNHAAGSSLPDPKLLSGWRSWKFS